MEQSRGTGVDGDPPELIIVYYPAGADVNIDTTWHLPLSTCARALIRLANGVCGSGCVLLVRNWEISPSGNWLQRCSVQTSRWSKGCTQQCKLPGRKSEGVSNKSAWRLNAVPRTFHFDVSNVHLFTRLDTQKLPLAGCANCQHGNYHTSRQS